MKIARLTLWHNRETTLWMEYKYKCTLTCADTIRNYMTSSLILSSRNHRIAGFTPFQFTTHVFLPLLINAFNKFANYSIRVRLEEANKQRGENYWIYIWKFIGRLLMVDVVWRGVGVPATNYTGNVWIAAASINWILMLPPVSVLQTANFPPT